MSRRSSQLPSQFIAHTLDRLRTRCFLGGLLKTDGIACRKGIWVIVIELLEFGWIRSIDTSRCRFWLAVGKRYSLDIHHLFLVCYVICHVCIEIYLLIYAPEHLYLPFKIKRPLVTVHRLISACGFSFVGCLGGVLIRNLDCLIF